MGGSVCIGIRRSSGEEVILDGWTNSIPFWSTDPAFMDENEEVIEELLQEGMIIPKLTYSEYGVILVDFLNKKVWSCQDYTVFGRLLASFWEGRDTYFPATTAEHVLDMHAAKRLEIQPPKFGYAGWVTTKSPSKIVKLLQARDEHGGLAPGVTLSFQAHMKWDPWEITDLTSCLRGSPEGKESLRAFLKDNGWKARAPGRVRKKTA